MTLYDLIMTLKRPFDSYKDCSDLIITFKPPALYP